MRAPRSRRPSSLLGETCPIARGAHAETGLAHGVGAQKEKAA
ncbi:hypothetical protein C7S17_2332 [Burkholderia thailandensis]|nr:hypothetical protein [Burkholderia thailandensis]